MISFMYYAIVLGDSPRNEQGSKNATRRESRDYTHHFKTITR